ncbi:NAD-dependent epimerase/dehydratase family protein [Sporichthya sp.]|uniref:NAD-dependent epimerase/dehydratase family protein n=1 Tax=Sporichthya sp. TaxID=65475 RepID=UPI00183BB944|nr:NAD-dependent epimerase/dehydratase family protein [Sporichthya sp.]MBA3743621.1 NAD-dependent epimerase/dehydratase family protein [Sporichthya sp.]
MGRVVLVTGVARHLGSALVRELNDAPDVDRVIGVDVVAPRSDLGRAEFVRADIRNPIIAKVIGAAEVDTVVHLSVTSGPPGTGGRAAMKELNVIGTMQLLAACQKAPSLRRLVVKSSTAVYGASPGDPAMFTEGTQPKVAPRSGFAKDAAEVEAYVRGFVRRRSDVDTTVLRFANIIGAGIDSPVTGLFGLPVVPTILGYDARLQFVHPTDALAVLRRAATEAHRGTYNVAGDGILLLSQAARRAGKPTLPVAGLAAKVAGQFLRRGGLNLSPELISLLTHGRAVDTTKLKTEFGYTPTYSTAAAFEEFLAEVSPGPGLGLVTTLVNRAGSANE